MSGFDVELLCPKCHGRGFVLQPVPPPPDATPFTPVPLPKAITCDSCSGTGKGITPYAIREDD